MRERRWPWFAAAALLTGAAVAAGWATHLYWLPCRGSMLVGTVLESFSSRNDFADGCLQRMDSGLPFSFDIGVQIPWVREFSAAAMALSAAAWLAVVVGLRWSVRTKLVAAVASLPGLVVSAVTVANPNGAALLSEWLFTWLSVPVAVAVFAAGAAVYAWQPEFRGPAVLRLLVLLWGSTAFDFFHQAADFSIMMGWSTANWDVPPATGVLTVATLLTSAVLTVIMAMRAPELDDRCRDSVFTTGGVATPAESSGIPHSGGRG